MRVQLCAMLAMNHIFDIHTGFGGDAESLHE